MASVISKSPSKLHSLDNLEDEAQRGRKRRRSSANSPPTQAPSTGSTTLRGRGRHRSVSHSQVASQDTSLAFDGRARSISPLGRKSPGRKYQKKSLQVPKANKHRSQSPSRSRSKGKQEGTPKPRRKRTRSRSRSHEAERDHEEENDEVDVVAED
jgi:hypothetical protein